MASGPTGTGWSDLAVIINDWFKPGNNIRTFATKFKEKHGATGDGQDPGTTPYKFGQFVDRHGGLLSGTALGQFLVDSGTRHWDAVSLGLLEYTVKHTLTRPTLDKQITFTIEEDKTGAATARAEIADQSGAPLTTQSAINSAGSYKINIICPPGNPRP